MRRALSCIVALMAWPALAADDLAVDVQNASEPSLCAEKDNVYLKLTSAEVRRFKVESVHPNYIGTIVVDRSAFDRIIAAGGYVSVNTGSAPEANSVPVPRDDAEAAMDAAACIACGACVASCKNASAHLFVGAKVSHLTLLPQGKPERLSRALNMVRQADAEGFGSCSNEGECEAVCPKQISIRTIAQLIREYTRASLAGAE